MKKVVKIIVIFLVAICMSAIMQTKSNAADIEISKTKKTLYVGAEFNLKITGTNKKITWTSSNKKVATVSSKGRVKAKKKGTTEITAKVGKQKLKCAIKVKNLPRESKKTKGVIYLTFDDGPSANITPKVLDILKKDIANQMKN